VTRFLILCDRFFSLPGYVFLALAVCLFLGLLAVSCARRGMLDRRALGIAGMAAVIAAVGVYGSYRVFRVYIGMLGGRQLPKVTLLAPKAGETIGTTVELRAHATDLPGALGPIAAVRDVEFWLYHRSFVEQHAGNRESKVFLGSVSGPTPDDLYATSWTCSNPYTPARDGDHSGGAGTRTYVLPNDGRPYSIQAHGLDDEWRANPGRPGYSARVTVGFTPCPAIDEGQAWRRDWELEEGFALDIDSEGYRFPTSIVFVPEPGPGPKDPLYFVTELRGAIKVVTNDRTVHTFADDFFRLELPYELPNMRAEIGLGAVSRARAWLRVRVVRIRGRRRPLAQRHHPLSVDSEDVLARADGCRPFHGRLRGLSVLALSPDRPHGGARGCPLRGGRRCTALERGP
jgi:hypothetical protein